MKKRFFILPALLALGSLQIRAAATMQDVLQQVLKNNFEKAATLKGKAMNGADAQDKLLAQIADCIAFNSHKYNNYDPLKAYKLYSQIIYNDHLLDSKVSKALREEKVNMEDLRQSIEANVLDAAKSLNTVAAYDKIIEACQGCSYLEDAKNAKSELVLANTLHGATLVDVEAYLAQEPADSPYRPRVERMRDSLAYQRLAKTSDAYTKYINDYPNSVYTPALKKEVEKLAFDEASQAMSLNAYAKYIANYPDAKGVSDFKKKIDEQMAKLHWKAEASFDDARVLCDSVAKKSYVAVKSDSWGVYSTIGSQLIPPSFEDVGDVHNGLLAVKVGGRWGLANIQNGKILYPANMASKSDISFVTPLFTAVNEGGFWGLVYKGDQKVVEPFAEGSMSNKMVKVIANNGVAITNGTRIVTVRPDGTVAHDSTYDEIRWRNSKDIDSKFIKTRTGKKYGILRPDGSLMEPPHFDMVPFFDADGVCILKDWQTEGWMDTTGHYLYNGHLTSYKDCGPDDKMVCYEVNGKFGFLDKTGKGQDLPLKYSALGDAFQSGFARVREGDKWEYINRSGSVVYTVPNAECRCKVVDGTLWVKDGSQSKFINKDGQVFDASGYDFMDDRIMSNYVIVGRGGKKGAIDRAGRVVVPCEFDEMSRYCNDYSFVTKGSHKGLYYKNTVALEPTFDNITDPLFIFSNDCNAFAEGGISNVVCVNGSKGGVDTKYIFKDGKVLFTVTDDVRLDKPVPGYAIVKTAQYGAFGDGRCALVGSKGELLVKLSYKDISYLKTQKGTYFGFKDASDRWGVLDAGGRVVVSAFADEVLDYDGFRATGRVGDDVSLFTKEGLPMLPKGYEVNGLVIKDKATGKYGVIDAKGNIRVFPIFDDAKVIDIGCAAVKKDSKWGILDCR